MVLLFVFLALVGCSNKKEQQIESKNVNSQIIVMDTLLEKPLFYEQTPIKKVTKQDKYKIYRQMREDYNDIEVYSLEIVMSLYKNGKSLLYRCENIKPDTLEIRNDSVVFNRKVLKPVASRKLVYNGELYTIKKYDYHKHGVIHSPFVNFYINDSLGMVLGRYAGQLNGVIYYGIQPKFSEIQNEIIEDSIFFKFQ